MDPSMIAALLSAKDNLAGSLAGIAGGAFGNSGEPYERAEKELGDFYNRARNVQNPFLQMGTGAIPQYQDWLKGQQNPSDFINNLMGKYQQSPWAKYQTDQAMRAAQNMGSASGLSGSTPLLQFAQQQAAGISSEDMQKWLQNVLGINTQYGQGLQTELTGGQNAANALTDINKTFGEDIAKMQYGKYDALNKQRSGLFGGLFNLL